MLLCYHPDLPFKAWMRLRVAVLTGMLQKKQVIFMSYFLECSNHYACMISVFLTAALDLYISHLEEGEERQ